MELSNFDQECIGPKILREELKYAIKNFKSGKVSELNEEIVNSLKIIDEDANAMPLNVINNIYETDRIPKKNIARECSNYKILVLMNQNLNHR